MPMLMIDLPSDEFMELRRLAKTANLPLTTLVNRMLTDIAKRAKKSREEEGYFDPALQLILPPTKPVTPTEVIAPPDPSKPPYWLRSGRHG